MFYCLDFFLVFFLCQMEMMVPVIQSQAIQLHKAEHAFAKTSEELMQLKIQFSKQQRQVMEQKNTQIHVNCNITFFSFKFAPCLSHFLCVTALIRDENDETACRRHTEERRRTNK